jgi:hypothetical protein
MGVLWKELKKLKVLPQQMQCEIMQEEVWHYERNGTVVV